MLLPHVTVACVIERDGRYLVVEEKNGGRRFLNQPAGHLEANESLTDAVRREALEETGMEFQPQGLVGIYLLRAPQNGIHYLRFAFCGHVSNRKPGLITDPEILRTHWLTAAELKARQQELRSPLVLDAIRDHQRGKRFSLDFLHHYL